jgi:hypothetical protein
VTRKFSIAVLLCSAFVQAYAAPSAPADPLNRLNPRSTVTAFLQACHDGDDNKAAQYLELGGIPARYRVREAPKLAKDLESLLNSASRFDVLTSNHESQGNLGDDPDPAIEHATTVNSNGQQFTIGLRRISLRVDLPFGCFRQARLLSCRL